MKKKSRVPSRLRSCAMDETMSVSLEIVTVSSGRAYDIGLKVCKRRRFCLSISTYNLHTVQALLFRMGGRVGGRESLN